jgi:hypothetical protein
MSFHFAGPISKFALKWIFKRDVLSRLIEHTPCGLFHPSKYICKSDSDVEI